jgi:acyl-coenzyme A synthetase/AMP-(fatty) acid ligase
MFPDVRFLRLGSESAFKSDVELYKKHFSSKCIMANGLATSEAGKITQFLINHNTEIEGNEAPVGYPMEGMEILLLDDEGKEVDTGEVGEIVVRSKYLAPGYWNQPELTETKFKTDSTGPEKRLFYTGDLGLRWPDGCLIHKGRKDFRIKIRGYGVDLIEVEQKVAILSGLRQALVGARQNDGRESSLVSYFTSDIEPPPSVSELRMFLKDKLADYMIPSAFIALEAIPLTANGKIDRHLKDSFGRFLHRSSIVLRKEIGKHVGRSS